MAVRGAPSMRAFRIPLDDRRAQFLRLSVFGRLGAGGAIGFAIGWWVLGATLLDPTETTWLAIGDRIQHHVGWMAFRDAPWSWPIGHIDLIVHPHGTMIAYTDSIPIVATLFKAAAPILPEAFQFFGWWLFAAYTLNGVFGLLLTREFTPRQSMQLAGAALIALSPMLMLRLQHEALAAHWIVLAALWLAVRVARRGSASYRWWHWALLLGFTGGVHPYLVAMTAPFAVATWLVAMADERRLRAWWHVVPIVGAPMAAVYAFGYFSVRGAQADGFGAYSADLLTFIAPQGYSAVLPELALTAGQWEGMAYLGLGILALAPLAVGALLWRRPSRRTLARMAPMLLVALALGVFAVSGTVRINGVPVADYEPLIRATGLPVDVVRASGRFVWPLHYLVVIAVLAGIATRLPPRAATVIVALGAILQLYDVAPGVERARTSFNWAPEEASFDPAFTDARRYYRQITLIPPHFGEFGCEVSADSDGGTRRVMLLAARSGVPTNSGLVARMDRTARDELCRQNARDLDNGNLPEDHIYLPHPRLQRDLIEAFEERLVCGSLNRFTVCVDDRIESPLRDALREQQRPR